MRIQFFAIQPHSLKSTVDIIVYTSVFCYLSLENWSYFHDIQGGLFQKKSLKLMHAADFASLFLLIFCHICIPQNVAIGRSLGHFRTTWRMDRCRCHSAGMRYVSASNGLRGKGWDYMLAPNISTLSSLFSWFGGNGCVVKGKDPIGDIPFFTEPWVREGRVQCAEKSEIFFTVSDCKIVGKCILSFLKSHLFGYQHIGSHGPSTNLPFGVCAIYFDLKVTWS